MMLLAIFITVFLIFALVVLGIGQMQKEKQVVEQRLTHLTPLEVKQGQILDSMNSDGSFYQRVLFPLAQNIYPFISRFIPFGEHSWAHVKLEQAGYRQKKYVQIFYGCQFICALGGLAVLSFEGLLLAKSLNLVVIMLALGGVGFGAMIPMLVVSSLAQKRQKQIQLALPDFLELLVICVEAGLSLDVAIQKIVLCQQDDEKTEALRKELVRYLSDIEFGKSRRDSLTQLAERTGLDDFRVFINSLILAYDMGSSIASTLRVQCDTLRSKRMSRAEEQAQKIPVKMVLPIYIFFFPAIFASIFGPLAMIVVKNVSAMFSGMH